MWAKKTQRWRQKNKRAVSPIIATILLVAITVVLAAVLYVLISGLTRGPGNTTLGSALALGTAAESQQTSGTYVSGSTITCGNTAATICYLYTFTVESAGGGITWNGVDFTVSGPGGLYAGAASYYAVLNIGGQTVATSYGPQVTTWTAGTAGSGTTAISSTQNVLVVLQGGATANLAGLGDTLNGLGVGSYSGTIHANIP